MLNNSGLSKRMMGDREGLHCGNFGKPLWKPVRFATPVELYTLSDELLSSKSLFETISTLQLLVVKSWRSFSFYDLKGNLDARKGSTSSKTVSRPSLNRLQSIASKSYRESCTASLNSKGLRRHLVTPIQNGLNYIILLLDMYHPVQSLGSLITRCFGATDDNWKWADFLFNLPSTCHIYAVKYLFTSRDD